MKPIVVLLLDGLGDRVYTELGGRTSNEAAKTPQLDAFCARGSNGLLWPLGPGRAPSSERAHWRMLGYADEEFPGRAVLEARPTEPNWLNRVKIEVKRSKIYSAKGTNSLSPSTSKIDAKIRMKK